MFCTIYEYKDTGLFGGYIASGLKSPGDREVWLIPLKGKVLARLNLEDGDVQFFDANVEGLKSLQRPNYLEWDMLYFSSMAFSGNKLILCPNNANMFVAIDIDTGKAEKWDSPMEVNIGEISTYRTIWSTGYFFKRVPSNEYAIFENATRSQYKINIETKELEKIPQTFETEDALRMQLSIGFKTDIHNIYYCNEDEWNSLEDIITGNITGDHHDPQYQIELPQIDVRNLLSV